MAAEIDENDDDAGIAVLRAACFEERTRGLEGVDGAKHVELGNSVPMSGVAALGHGAGIAEQHVDAAEFLSDA